MVTHHLLVARFRVEIQFFKAVNIHDHIQNWKNITNNQFILNIIKNGVSMKFQEEPIWQYVPYITFSDTESEIIGMVFAKLLKKG